MRYQRISPDSQPLSNGRRGGSNNWKTYKEDEEEDRVMEEIINSGSGVNGSSRFRSSSNANMNNNGVENPSNSNDGDVLLQWGHRKRSRRSSVMAVSPTDDSSSSSSAAQLLHPNKLQRRSSAPQASTSNGHNTNGTMNPPSSLPSSTNVVPKAPNKSSSRIASSTASPVRRGSEEAKSSSPGQNRLVQSRSRAAVKKSPAIDKKTSPSSPGAPIPTTRGDVSNGSALQQQQNHPEAISVASKSAVVDATNGVPMAKAAGGGGGEKTNGGGEAHEWPRIYIALSKKEKEEDFMAMKGSKLPHRPKKRPKAIDRMLQYCYPGMWLSDLTRGRYEVREKKSTKKQKRKGLKGMESIESDSE